MSPTGIASGILQINLTRWCNLRCVHYYSASSSSEREGQHKPRGRGRNKGSPLENPVPHSILPSANGAYKLRRQPPPDTPALRERGTCPYKLEVELLAQAIADASVEGYTVVNFSGGEPTLYEPLAELLETAHRYQMRISVVANGIFWNERCLERLKRTVNFIAINLDGKPELHNRLRNAEGAFERMVARLEGLRQSGIPFGFIFTMTRLNFRQLDWIANFAIEQGAKLLQIHPLETTEPTNRNLSELEPRASIAAYGYLKAMELREKIGDRLKIRLDLLHQAALRANSERVYANEREELLFYLPFAEIASPLVIETDGTVVPLQRGIARRYALGNLRDASLRELVRQWREQSYPACRRLHQQVYQDLIIPV